MEFKNLFSLKSNILDSYKARDPIQFQPRGTGNKQTGPQQEVVPVDLVSVAGEDFSFSEFIEILEHLFNSQSKLAKSFEIAPVISFKDGPLSRFLASSLFLQSLGQVNPLASIDAACSKAFGKIDFASKPKMPALDQKTSQKIEEFFTLADNARNVVENETAQVYSNFRKELGDYGSVLNRWFREAEKADLWDESAQGWVDGAKRFPDFLAWAAPKLSMLNRPNSGLKPDQTAALTKLKEVLSPSGSWAQANSALTLKAEELLRSVIAKRIVESGELPVWFRIRVLLAFLKESEKSTYSVRQNPDKRQSKSTSQYVRRLDSVSDAGTPQEFDGDVPDYSEETLRELIKEFNSGRTGELNEAISRDLGSMSISELLKNSSPINIFHGLNRGVLNNFFLGGASARNINGSILKGFAPQVQDEYGQYFAQKFFDNFVNYCAMIGYTGNLQHTFKSINVFMFSGKSDSGASRGAYAASVLFPVTTGGGPVLINNRSIQLGVRKERKQETGFVAELRTAIQNVGGTANVFITDQQGNTSSVLNVPWDQVKATGKNPKGTGGIDGVREQAHADVMVLGQNKAGNPANFSISLKREESHYLGGTSYERSTTNQSRADRAQGASNVRTSSEVDGFAIGVRQAYALAERGEKAISAIMEKVKSGVETFLMRKVPDNELSNALKSAFEAFVMFSKDPQWANDPEMLQFQRPLIELFMKMKESQGFVGNQIRLEYGAKSFKEFRKPDGENAVLELFWSLIYDKEGTFRKALFGDLADSSRTQSGAESCSHVVYGYPSITAQGNNIIISPIGGKDAVIVSNAKFALHNPVDPKEMKEFGITQNLELFKKALPVIIAGQSGAQSMAGIPDLYPRIVPISRLIGRTNINLVEKRIEDLFTLNGLLTNGEISKEQFESQTKKLSDELVNPLMSEGKFRIEQKSLSDDITNFVSVYNRKSSSSVQLTVDVFLTLGEMKNATRAAIAEAVIQIDKNPGALYEEITVLVRDALSEVLAQMPPKAPSIAQNKPQRFSKENLQYAFQNQIRADLELIARSLQEKLQAALPNSLASVRFTTRIEALRVLV